MARASRLDFQSQALHASMVGASFSIGDKLLLQGELSVGKFGVSTLAELAGQHLADILGDMTNQNDYTSWLRKYVLPGLASGALYVVGSKITGVDGRAYMKPFLVQAGASMIHQGTMGSKSYQNMAAKWSS
jgi:hypothetical protein